jgi:membrane-associated protein
MLMSSFLNPTHLVQDFGYIGLFLIIFLESGIIFGFFLPGDSLLFAAGLLAAQGQLNLAAVILVAVAGAILGNNAGYYTGKKAGHGLFHRKESWLFSKKRVTEAHEFFEKQGGKALVLARFIPAVRTFVPIVAGVGEMEYKHFFKYNALGGLLWGISMPVLGYTLGKNVPNIDKYILPMIFLIILLSALPFMFHYFKNRSR